MCINLFYIATGRLGWQVDNMDHDIAWDEFKKQSAERVQKTSVAGKLDTLAAPLNEIQTDTERIAEVVPRILGDENVVDEANLSAEPPAEEAGLGDLLGMACF